MWKLVSLLLAIAVVGISLSPAAQQYYTAALSAMQMGDCSAAISWFEKALTEDPSIETVDPNVKLWIGVCSYEIGDYAKAKDFLRLYPDNELAKTILKKIEMGLSPEEREWELIKSLISRETFIAQQQPETPSTPSTVTEVKGKSPILMFLGIFVVTFAALMILELKFAIISTIVAKIPRVRIVIGEVEIKEVVHESMEEKEEEKEEVEEKEIEIDVEELFNSPLEVVDKLIYGEDFEVEEEKEGKEEQREAEEEKTEMEMVAEELVSAEEEEKKEEVGTVEETEMPAEEKPPEVPQETAVSAGEITEEDIEEIEKKAKEILSETEEEEEEGISVDLAGKSADEILEELEEKEEYDEEDAEKIIHAIRLLVSPEGGEGEEET